MELRDLTAYAKERHGLNEEPGRTGVAGFSALTDPVTGKWVALLMRQWDGDAGEEIQRCDLKCGRECLAKSPRPWLTGPYRMKGERWVGVALTDDTDEALVRGLLDRAVAEGRQRGALIVLEPLSPGRAASDTPLPRPARPHRPEADPIPPEIRRMRQLYEYGNASARTRDENFVRQGTYMRDYVDSAPFTGTVTARFPTYHDLSVYQLRGYFAWRADVRKGLIRPIDPGAAMIYVFELLNGIGAASPEEALERLLAFEAGYPGWDEDSPLTRSALRRWMTDLCAVSSLPPEKARPFVDPALLSRDEALLALKAPQDRTDDEIAAALGRFAGKLLDDSPAARTDAGKRLLGALWRGAAGTYREEDRDLFTLCFGEPVTRPWYPFSGAVYLWRDRPADRVWRMDEIRSYECRAGAWTLTAYEALSADRRRLGQLLRRADGALRRRLKTGRYLRQRPDEAWAEPLVARAIEAAERAARPRVVIDRGSLDRIRAEAEKTRLSLMTESETGEDEPMLAAPPKPEPVPEPEPPPESDAPLDRHQAGILRALLEGRDPRAAFGPEHLTPEMAADSVNAALLDLIGDSAVLCEGGTLRLMEDYIDDIRQILGGSAS